MSTDDRAERAILSHAEAYRLVEEAREQRDRAERAERERDELVRLLNREVMPRFVELYEASGLGDARASVAAQAVYAALLPYRHVWDTDGTPSRAEPSTDVEWRLGHHAVLTGATADGWMARCSSCDWSYENTSPSYVLRALQQHSERLGSPT